MPSQGPLLAGAGADDASFGDRTWSNPGRVTADDGSLASCSCSKLQTTHYLKATNFGFSIPSEATINGIVVEWKKLADDANRFDARSRIIKGGTIGSTDKSSAIQWSFSSPIYVSYGGAADLWGLTWTPAEVNDSSFGAVIAGAAVATAGYQYLIDACRITVHYTEGGGGDPVEVIPTTATLTLATFAPTVTATANQTVTPTTKALAITAFAPTVSTPRLVTPTTKALTLTTFAPSVATPILCTPATATLTLSTFAPTVSTPRVVTPGTASLTLTTFSPAASTPRLCTPTTASLTISTFAPVVSTPRLVTPTTATLTVSGLAPTVSTPRVATPTTAVLATTVFTPTITIGETVAPQTATLTLTAYAPIAGDFAIGPFCVVASQSYVAGSVGAQGHVPGSVKAQYHVPGSVGAQGHVPGSVKAQSHVPGSVSGQGC